MPNHLFTLPDIPSIPVQGEQATYPIGRIFLRGPQLCRPRCRDGA